ncbi:MAG: hypothetical protein R2824_18055 [Saprospiraceae bacterium]
MYATTITYTCRQRNVTFTVSDATGRTLEVRRLQAYRAKTP